MAGGRAIWFAAGWGGEITTLNRVFNWTLSGQSCSSQIRFAQSSVPASGVYSTLIAGMSIDRSLIQVSERCSCVVVAVAVNYCAADWPTSISYASSGCIDESSLPTDSFKLYGYGSNAGMWIAKYGDGFVVGIHLFGDTSGSLSGSTGQAVEKATFAAFE